MEVLRSKLFSLYPQIVFGMSTRNGGVSAPPYGLNLSVSVGDEAGNVRKNRTLFFDSLNIDTAQLAYPLQVHSSNIRYAAQPGRYPDTDGLVTDRESIYLIVTIADCLPVFLFDPINNVVAGVHAGWRGSSRNIVRNAIDLMAERWQTRSSDLVVYLGPSAGVCCYEVGDEVAGLFSPEFSVAQSNGKYHLDIPLVNVAQLISEGVREENIEHENVCTICKPEKFHSYRRDGKRSGRMMGVIGINKS